MWDISSRAILPRYVARESEEIVFFFFPKFYFYWLKVREEWVKSSIYKKEKFSRCGNVDTHLFKGNPHSYKKGIEWKSRYLVHLITLWDLRPNVGMLGNLSTFRGILKHYPIPNASIRSIIGQISIGHAFR